uniref:Uncharacterized protein n=1 Tax=Cacopsylla melanoneura TaxID=428564 RepID=A0A8D9F487_9HEMI
MYFFFSVCFSHFSFSFSPRILSCSLVQYSVSARFSASVSILSLFFSSICLSIASVSSLSRFFRSLLSSSCSCILAWARFVPSFSMRSQIVNMQLSMFHESQFLLLSLPLLLSLFSFMLFHLSPIVIFISFQFVFPLFSFHFDQGSIVNDELVDLLSRLFGFFFGII